VRLVGDFMARALQERAVDAQAAFPRPFPVDVPAMFARIGSTLKRWFGFGDDPRR
jgi:hypothetical protein